MTRGFDCVLLVYEKIRPSATMEQEGLHIYIDSSEGLLKYTELPVLAPACRCPILDTEQHIKMYTKVFLNEIWRLHPGISMSRQTSLDRQCSIHM